MQRITPSYCLINEVAPTVNRTQIATATTWSTNHYTMEANVHFSKNGTYNIYFWPIFRRENEKQSQAETNFLLPDTINTSTTNYHTTGTTIIPLL